MLKLSHLTPFAAGGNRYCFVHPDDPTKCVKPLKPGRRRKIRLFPSLDFDELEFSEYRRLTKFGSERAWRHLPRHFGMIETDMGRASVMELIRNNDGSPAPTLIEKIRRGELPEQAIDEFLSSLRALALPHWSDVSLGNLVCARISPDSPGMNERERLFVVDGMACYKRRIIRSHITFLSRRNARRYRERFESRLKRYIEKQKSASC